MKMKSLIRALLSASICQLMTANPAFCQTTHQLKATITGLADQSVVVQYKRQGMFVNDTVQVRRGRFIHPMPTTDGDIATLLLSPSNQLTFWLQAPLVSITGDYGPPTNLKCIGTPENDLLELYRNTVEKPYNLRKQGKSSAEADPIVLQEYQATRRFIKQHPASLTAAYLLYWQTVYDVTSFNQLEPLLAKLSPSVKSSYWAQKAVTRMYNIRNRPRIGKKLPAFSLPDATGKLVSLNSFKGKYVLIDFWGTWCVPCIEGIPELQAVHSKYKSRLAIISIALERPTDRKKWLKAIDKYGMSWTQTAEFTKSKEGVNELYNVVEYPTFLLADPEGVLLAKLRYGKVETQIRQLLSK